MNPNETGAPELVTSSNSRSWLDYASRQIVLLAASHTPGDLAGRLAEEWLSDLNERHSASARLRFALGCCWAVRVISLEAASAARAAAAAAAPGSVTLYSQPIPSRLTPRSSAVLLILILHGVLVYALATGLARSAFEKVVPRISVSFPSVATRPDPPQPAIPPPSRLHQSIEVPQPDIHIDTPPDPAQGLSATVADPQPAAVGPEVAPLGPAINRIEGGPDRNFPNTEDFYPPASKRLRETGWAMVSVCVNEAGRLIREPVLEQSSGYARLDEAAVRLARAGSGRYRATTENGRPVEACYPFRIRFEMRE